MLAADPRAVTPLHPFLGRRRIRAARSLPAETLSDLRSSEDAGSN